MTDRNEPTDRSDRYNAVAAALTIPLEGGSSVERYGVRLEVTDHLAVASSQGASARQVAVALYLLAKTQEWAVGHYKVSDAVADEVIALAAEDGRLHKVRFEDSGQQQKVEGLREALTEKPHGSEGAEAKAEPPHDPLDSDAEETVDDGDAWRLR